MLATRAEILVYLRKSASIDAAGEALLDMIHPLVESCLKSWMQDKLEYQQHVELLPIGQESPPDDPLPEHFQKSGDRFVAFDKVAFGSRLQLKYLPVALTGLEVREDIAANAGQASSAFADATILVAGVDYWLDVNNDPATGLSSTGILHRYGAWPTEPRSVKATYYGGHTAARLNGEAAGAIKLSAIEMVAAAYKRAESLAKGAGPVVSESIGSYSYATAPQFVAALHGLTSDVPPHVQQRLFKFRNFGRLGF